MRIVTIARTAALASVQLSFITKQLKKKTVHEVLHSALSKVARWVDDSARSAPGAHAVRSRRNSRTVRARCPRLQPESSWGTTVL